MEKTIKCPRCGKPMDDTDPNGEGTLTVGDLVQIETKQGEKIDLTLYRCECGLAFFEMGE